MCFFFFIRLQSIIKNDSFWFYGITGNVSFDSNGNRKNSLYALANVIDNNGTIDYFGVWADYINATDSDTQTTDTETDSEYDHEEPECEECTVDIIWPDEFIAHGLIPRSNKLIEYRQVGINSFAITLITICSLISMCFVILTIIISWKWRENIIIRAASWKLNILTCIGCLLTQMTIIMYSWEPTLYLCNLREWLMCISFTLVFMPLFLKTYRVSVIFTGMLTVNTIKDFKLVIGVLICLLIDSIILTIFTILEVEHVVSINGPKYEIHKLLDIQEQYLYCIKDESNKKFDIIFSFVISGWKVIQLLFGLSVALIVSRVSLEYMQVFNETNSQIFATMFTIIIFVIGALPLVAGQIKHPTHYFIVMGVAGLLITNVVLGANVVPRLWAVFKGHEQKFQCGQDEAFKSAMKSAFKNRTKRSLMNIIHEAELLNIHNQKHINEVEINQNSS